MGQTNFSPLLFIFPTTSKNAMHMKNMKSNIDIFWISAHGKVVKVYRNVPPSDTELYPSVVPVKYAIEAKPGKLPYKEGDSLDMKRIIERGSLPK
jgi:uncharacterized membrane protein (UPF0127 family)